MSSVAAITAANGGGSFDASSLEPVAFTSGFAVGGLVPTRILNSEDQLTVAEIDRFRAQVPEGAFLGTWIGPDGRVFLDASQHVDDLDSALILASLRGELAIWDFANSQEIALPVGQEIAA